MCRRGWRLQSATVFPEILLNLLHRRFYTQKFLHRTFYTQMLSHTDAFTHSQNLSRRKGEEMKGPLSPGFAPPCPARPLGPLVPSGPVSVLLVPLSGYLVVFATARLSCGIVCCDCLAPVFTSPHGNKGFGPLWGFALYTMLRVLFRCLFFLH